MFRKSIVTLFSNFSFWYILLTQKSGRDRAYHIFEQWNKMQMSSLYIFLISLPIIFTMSLTFEKPLIMFFILLFGANLVFTMIFIAKEREVYWHYREIELEEMMRIEKEREDRIRIEKMRILAEQINRRQEEEKRQRVKEELQRKENERFNKFGKHLSVLGLPITTTDFTQIKKKYRDLIKQNHPDVNKQLNSNEVIDGIVKAYKELEKHFGSV